MPLLTTQYSVGRVWTGGLYSTGGVTFLGVTELPVLIVGELFETTVLVFFFPHPHAMVNSYGLAKRILEPVMKLYMIRAPSSS